MKIINLKSENIKRLIAVDITPDSNTVVISGKNGQGKSSVLDSILYALAGTKEIEKKPIREGEDHANIKLDLGDVIVERSFKEGSSKLIVSTKEGAKYSNPQEILDGMMGKITFDPLAFAGEKPDVQSKMLRKLASVDVDFAQIEIDNAADFKLRTKVNTDGKDLAAVVDALKKEIPTDTPDELVDVAILADSRSKLIEAQNTRDKVKSDIINMGEKIADAEANLRKMQELHDAYAKRLNDVPEIDQNEILELSKAILGANEINNAVIKKKELSQKNTRLEELRKQSGDLTAKIDARKKEATDAVDAAKFPIEGLSINETGVVYNGIPFTQSSSAEKLKVSTAVAMAMNPKLRVIRIKDGALLDDDNFAVLKEMAEKNDFQIWIERVGADPMGIVIEDGKVVGA